MLPGASVKPVEAVQLQAGATRSRADDADHTGNDDENWIEFDEWFVENFFCLLQAPFYGGRGLHHGEVFRPLGPYLVLESRRRRAKGC